MAERLAALQPFDVLLLGEQHDAPAHQELEREAVQTLAARGQLAAVALEMLPSGATTVAVPAHASQAQVQAAVQWNEAGWPWATYGPVVMAAVRAGIPVLGANLQKAEMQAVMRNNMLDGALPGPALKAQQQAIRLGHCGMLPESQVQPMTRVQIARDQRMAQVLSELAQRASSGQAVLLIAGAGHVDLSLGVPQHLPVHLKVKVAVALADTAQAAIDFAANEATHKPAADALWATAARPAKDYCAGFKAPNPKPALLPTPSSQ